MTSGHLCLGVSASLCFILAGCSDGSDAVDSGVLDGADDTHDALSGSGGVMGSGGKPGSGGAMGSGGKAGSGGVAGSGGKPGSGGAMGSGGKPGSGGATGSGGVGAGGTTCPAPPAGASVDEVNAYNLENDTRLGMGIPCATMVPALNTASQLHCLYYVNNKAAGRSVCVADAHSEVSGSGCTDFVAASFSQRDTLAGYAGGSFEVMAFSSNGTQSLQMWIDSVWHRTPVLSPWTRDLGYGNATNGSAKCDTMDFGEGTKTPDTVVAVYPYDGQTNVPTSFNGANEGPTPPVPPSGWPSGYPIHVYAKKATVTTHEIRSGSCSGTKLDHIWITPGSANDPSRLLRNESVLYTHAPLQASTTYCVIIQGTQALTGNPSLDLSWTFKTK